MGNLGKVLVLVHGAVSIGLLAWAFGVYTQRIAWTTASDKKDTPGIFEKQAARVKELGTTADRAYTRWSGNLARIKNLEGERYPRRTFYSIQLYMVEYGTAWDAQKMAVVNVPRPVQQLQTARNGYLDITNPFNRPPVEVRPGVPLDSVAGYTTKSKQFVADILASQKLNADAITARAALTNEIVGVTNPKLVKGLRLLISEQKIIEEQATIEETYSGDFVTNREADFGLLKKRRDAMTARIAELDKVKDGKAAVGE